MAIATNSSASRTLPDHERCDRHRHYKLSCEQYESLITRAGHLCEICRRVPGAPGRLKLFIDHGGPLWAVRGLLCTGCNTRLEYENRFSQAASDYLDRSWWKQQCAAHGIPVDPRNAQPPVGSAFRNQWGVIWIHARQDWWHAPRQPARGTVVPFWDSLYNAYGPHNLVPVDLRAGLADGSLPDSVEYALRNSVSWSDLRALLVLPPPPPSNVPGAYVARDSVSWLKTPESAARELRALLSRDERLRLAELLSRGD